MADNNDDDFKPGPYSARVLERLNDWGTSRVGIFEALEDGTEKQIGEYQRNYSLLRTFHPFVQNGKWYALYSPRYMYTRIMTLPDCKDIGGEDSSNVEYRDHFCPVAYYVPTLENGDLYVMGEEYHTDEKLMNSGKKWGDYYREHDEQITKGSGTFGFVAGCIWGDDTSWKLQWLDLSLASIGVIKREERFGYLELPDHIELRKAINFYCDSGLPRHFIIATQKVFHVDQDGIMKAAS